MATQKTASYDFDNYTADTLTRPRDKAWSNWKKWPTVGDKVQGYIRDAFYRPAERDANGQGFSDQRGITLEQPNGELINVGIKMYPFVLAHTDNLRIGDPLTIVFEGEGEKKSKVMNAPKIFGFYGKNLPENAGNRTVKEMTDLDREIGGTKEQDVLERNEEDVSIVPVDDEQAF